MNRDEQQFISVGYHKGEMDFSVNCEVENLTYEQMKELREMIVVAIGQMEQMWARGREEINKPSQNNLTPPKPLKRDKEREHKC